MLNIDNYMDDLFSKYSEKDIKAAVTRAKQRAEAKVRDAEITDKRSKVLAALTDYFITVFGKADKDLVDEFEKELIKIENKAGAPTKDSKADVKVYTNITDDEKLRKFIDDLMRF